MCAHQEKQLGAAELSLAGLQSGGGCMELRGFSWALLSWHYFHAKTGDHTAMEPEHVLQYNFFKTTLFKYFLLILFRSQGAKPLNQRQFCFPSCQQYFGYFKNVGQG